MASLSPHAPWAAVMLPTIPSVTAGPGKRHFYLRPAAITLPPEASLPLRRLAPVVARRPRHPQVQLATGLGEGHPGGGRMQLDCKDEVVSRLSAPLLVPVPAPRALTGLVKVQREVGGPVDVGPPARLHPGRGVAEDVDMAIVQGVRRPRARLELLALRAARVAAGGGAGQGRMRVGLGCGGHISPHVPTCPGQDTSHELPRTVPATVPDSPERQEVGGVAVGAVGGPGAAEAAGAALLPAGEAGGRGGAWGRGQRLGGSRTPNPGGSGKAGMEQQRSHRPIPTPLALGIGAAAWAILAQKTKHFPAPGDAVLDGAARPSSCPPPAGIHPP